MAQDRQLTGGSSIAHQGPALVSPRAGDKHRLEKRWVLALTQMAMLSQASMTPFGDVGTSRLDLCIFGR